MKTCQASISIIFLLCCFGIAGTNFAQPLPEMIALREIALPEGTNEIMFQNKVKAYCEHMRIHSKGLCGMLMKGDRGQRDGKYLYAFTADFIETRDYYFPSEEVDYPHYFAMMENAKVKWEDIPGLMNAPYTDFVVLGFDEMDNPVLGELIAVRYLEIKRGMEREFEQFVINDLHTALQEHVDGVSIYILKGERGEKAGQYAFLWVMDTGELRDLYFPPPGGHPSTEFERAWAPVNDLFQRFIAYQVNPEEDIYTDYIVVR